MFLFQSVVEGALQAAADALAKGKKKRNWVTIAETAEKKLLAALLAKFEKDKRLPRLNAQEAKAAREALETALKSKKFGEKELMGIARTLQASVPGMGGERAGEIMKIVEKYAVGTEYRTVQIRELMMQTRAIAKRAARVPELFRLPLPALEGQALRKVLEGYEKPGAVRNVAEEARAMAIRAGRVGAQSRPVQVVATAAALVAIASMGVEECAEFASKVYAALAPEKQRVVPKSASEEERMTHLTVRVYNARSELEKLKKKANGLEAEAKQGDFKKLAGQLPELEGKTEALVDDAMRQVGMVTADEIAERVGEIERELHTLEKQVEALEKDAEFRRPMAEVVSSGAEIAAQTPPKPITVEATVYDMETARQRFASLRGGTITRDAYLERLHRSSEGNYCSEFVSNVFDVVYGPGASVALGIRGKDAWQIDDEVKVHGGYVLPAATPLEKIPEGAIVRFRVQGSRYQGEAGDEPTHAGVYLGGGKFVHMVGANVRIERLEDFLAEGGHMKLADIVVPPKEVIPETHRETRVVVRTLKKGESLLALVTGMAREGIIEREQVAFYMSQAWRHNEAVLARKRNGDVQLSFEVPEDLKQAVAKIEGTQPWVLDYETPAFETPKPYTVTVDRRSDPKEKRTPENQVELEVSEETAQAILELNAATDFEKHVLLAIATKERGGGGARAIAKEAMDTVQDVVGSHALVHRYGAFQIDYRVAMEYCREVEKKNVTEAEAEEILRDVNASAKIALWNLRNGERILWVIGKRTGETLSEEQSVVALAVFHNGGLGGVIGVMQQVALREISEKMDERGEKAFEVHADIAEGEDLTANGYLPVLGTAGKSNGELAAGLLWLASGRKGPSKSPGAPAFRKASDAQEEMPIVIISKEDEEAVFRETEAEFSKRGRSRTDFFTTRAYGVMDRLHLHYCGTRMSMPTEEELMQ